MLYSPRLKSIFMYAWDVSGERATSLVTRKMKMNPSPNNNFISNSLFCSYFSFSRSPCYFPHPRSEWGVYFLQHFFQDNQNVIAIKCIYLFHVIKKTANHKSRNPLHILRYATGSVSPKNDSVALKISSGNQGRYRQPRLFILQKLPEFLGSPV